MNMASTGWTVALSILIALAKARVDRGRWS